MNRSGKNGMGVVELKFQFSSGRKGGGAAG